MGLFARGGWDKGKNPYFLYFYKGGNGQKLYFFNLFGSMAKEMADNEALFKLDMYNAYTLHFIKKNLPKVANERYCNVLFIFGIIFGNGVKAVVP